MLSAAALEWLEDRGLDHELAIRYGAESLRPRGVSSGEWIALPFVRDDSIVNRQYREIESKTFRRDQGGAMCFWNEAVLDDAGLATEPLIITEGLEDALSVIQAGFQRTISMPNGSQSNPEAGVDARAAHYKFIDDVREKLHPERIRRVIIAADADAKGFALTEDLAQILSPSRCMFVSYPDGCKDANDVLVRFGVARLRQCIEAARWVNVAGVRTFKDYPPGADADPIVWRSGIGDAIDAAMGFMPGYVSISTGIPSHGKTQFLKQIAWSLCGARGGIGKDGALNMREGAPINVAGVASFEEKMPREYAQSALRYLIGRPKSGGSIGPRWTKGEIDLAMDWLTAHVIPIDPHGYVEKKGRLLEEVVPTVEWLLDAIQTATVRHGAQFHVVDPWSDVVQERGRGQSEHEYIGETLGRFKRAARMFNVHIHLAAHPKKIEPDPKRGGLRPPGPYDISGSAHWFNASSLGWTVHRAPEDNAPNRTMVDVWKSKFQAYQGKPGKCYLHFDGLRGRFEEW